MQTFDRWGWKGDIFHASRNHPQDAFFDRLGTFSQYPETSRKERQGFELDGKDGEVSTAVIATFPQNFHLYSAFERVVGKSETVGFPGEINPEDLPPLPPSSVASPVQRSSHLSIDSQVNIPGSFPDVPDEALTTSIGGRLEESGGPTDVDLRSSDARGAPTDNQFDYYGDPASLPDIQSEALDRPGPIQPRSPVRLRPRLTGSPPAAAAASQAASAYSPNRSPTLSHHSPIGQHSAPPPLQVYPSPVSFYGPHASIPHYYNFSPSVGVPTPIVPHPPRYSHQFEPAFAIHHSAATDPVEMATMQAPNLERRTTVGSRAGTSADLPAPSSPHNSTASVEQRTASDHEATGTASSPETAQELTERIQSTMANMASMSAALPDFHQLLSSYRETHGQLGLREELNRRAETQQADLKQKEQHIEALGKQLDGIMAKHSAETSKLRLAVGNLEEKERELLEQLMATERDRVEAEIYKEGVTKRNIDLKEEIKRERETAKRHKEEAMAEKEAAKTQMEEALLEKQAAEKEKEEIQKVKEDAIKMQEGVARQKEAVEREFNTWKKAAEEKLDEKRSEMDKVFEDESRQKEEQLDRIREELGVKLDQEKETLRAEVDKERAERESEFETKLKGFEDSLAKERDDWHGEREKLLQELQTEHDQMVKERDGWQEEKSDLSRQWQTEREALISEWESKCQSLVDERVVGQETSQKAVEDFEKKLKAVEDEKIAIANSADEVRQAWEEDRAKREMVIDKLREVVKNMEKEKGKLQRMVETFGEVADFKSKGDSF